MGNDFENAVEKALDTGRAFLVHKDTAKNRYVVMAYDSMDAALMADRRVVAAVVSNDLVEALQFAARTTIEGTQNQYVLYSMKN